MKTLADLKRRLTVGAVVTLVYSHRMPNNRLGMPRKVVKVQTNGVWFESLNAGISASWLQWPKVALLRITENGWSVMGPEELELLRYEIK